jgi:hypothetical protein
MKLKTDLQKLYSDLLNEIVAAKKDTLCLHCAHEKKNHKEIPTTDGADAYSKPILVCDGADDCLCEKFQQNEIYLHDLELRAGVLQWVLDQEDTCLEVDDCIMPETVVHTLEDRNPLHPEEAHVTWDDSLKLWARNGPFTWEVYKFETPWQVSVFDLDEPYRTILLESSNKLPVILPSPTNDFVSIASYAVMPNGSVHRTVKTVPEKEYVRKEQG